jgi:hypothetical protein
MHAHVYTRSCNTCADRIKRTRPYPDRPATYTATHLNIHAHTYFKHVTYKHTHIYTGPAIPAQSEVEGRGIIRTGVGLLSHFHIHPRDIAGNHLIFGGLTWQVCCAFYLQLNVSWLFFVLIFINNEVLVMQWLCLYTNMRMYVYMYVYIYVCIYVLRTYIQACTYPL